MAYWFSKLPNPSLLLGILGGASAVTFLAALLLLPLLLIRLPEDYFLRPGRRTKMSLRRGEFLNSLPILLKNGLGLLLLLAGLIMLIAPGQGLLTILAGLTVMDFPGKKRLELRLISIRGVLRGINLIRRKAGRPPLLRPPADPS